MFCKKQEEKWAAYSTNCRIYCQSYGMGITNSRGTFFENGLNIKRYHFNQTR